MAKQKFKASLSKGRASWCVIFPHPMRSGKDGQAGLRVRRGLGTPDESEAQSLVDQLNELLGNKIMWDPSMRETAERQYDSTIVAAFYDDLMPEFQDPMEIRDSVLPMPTKDDGYARALLVGTTGAGKTTILRQLIGTDPTSERFPSTSAAKTTTCNIEIILQDGDEYRAVVTFFSRSYVRQHIEECVVAAVMAYLESRNTGDIEKKLLEHSEQRFRLSYVLGTTKAVRSGGLDNEVTDDEDLYDEDLQDDEEEEDEFAADPIALSQEDRLTLVKSLEDYIRQACEIAEDVQRHVAGILEVSVTELTGDEELNFLELLEGELYGSEAFQVLVDQLLDDVEDRFSYLVNGNVVKKKSGWASHWHFSSTDREAFIKTMNRFSSNYAPSFGRLLTPLVEGIRAAGPFVPTWYSGSIPQLVLMDGEGLGHTPDSTSSISTSITRRYKHTDAILLVDNAAQPMQAAPIAVLQSVVAGGYQSKLSICFTHFDEVKGDNIPNVAMRKEHVLSSLDNAVTAVGKALGPRAEKALANLKEGRTFFLSRIQAPVMRKKRSLSYRELGRLLDTIKAAIEPPKPTEAVPVYDFANFVLGIQKASQEFHKPWLAKLKLRYDPAVGSEHWSRIKALARRLGVWGVDEYDTLKPVADLLSRLQEHIYLSLNNPLDWKPPNAPEDMRQTAIDNIMQELEGRLFELVEKRLFTGKVVSWRTAYDYRGPGSTRVRAHDIRKIYDEAAPIPGEIPTPDSHAFLQEIRDLVRESIKAGGGEIEGD